MFDDVVIGRASSLRTGEVNRRKKTGVSTDDDVVEASFTKKAKAGNAKSAAAASNLSKIVRVFQLILLLLC